MPTKKLVVIGGVAGGASAAARARRLDEDCEIIVFDRGPFVSFANCGLPYYVGDIIVDENKLLVASPELFRDRFAIDVRVRHDILSIDRARKVVTVHDLDQDKIYEERFDTLVLSPGASAVRPPFPGSDLDGVFVLRTIPDSRKIREFLAGGDKKHAVVVGGGFIGLEMAENLAHRELGVTIVERDGQVLPPLDPEMAALLQDRLTEKGVEVLVGSSVRGLRRLDNGRLEVHLDSGATFETDLVFLGVGVRPETKLAVDAGIELGQTGGIQVDDQMRTSDPNIFAVGDAVEKVDVVTGQKTLMPLAGPANRQGRIAADVIFGRDSRFRGVQGTAVCGCFGLTAACTGASEKGLAKAGIHDYRSSYLHPGHHVGYYPGAKRIHLKLIWSKTDGRVYGAQAVAEEGAVRRIDVISVAIQRGLTVYDLEELELCYAPQYGAAKDPVNLAGFVAANTLRGDMPTASWCDVLDRIDAKETSDDVARVLLDVRSVKEHEEETVPGSINVPLEQLRARHGELPKGKPIELYCAAGQRAYYATRMLMQLGYEIYNLPGGIQTYRMIREGRKSASCRSASSS